MPVKKTERRGEGARLLRAWAKDRYTSRQAAAILGYSDRDSWFRLLRYEHVPGWEVCERLSALIRKPEAWVLHHWTIEVSRRRTERRAQLRRAS